MPPSRRRLPGAAVVHIHVRDPETGKGSRDPALYREVVERAARQQRGHDHQPDRRHGRRSRNRAMANRRCSSAPTRIWSARWSGWRMSRSCCRKSARSIAARSISATATTSTYRRPTQLRAGAKRIQELGVKPELEVFDTGHLWFAKQMLKEGLLDAAAAVPVLPRHSVGRARRHRHHEGDEGQPAPTARTGQASASAACRCRWSRRRCCWAATCASGWRTTCILKRASIATQRQAGREGNQDHRTSRAHDR